jgi:ribonuclease P protein component
VKTLKIKKRADFVDMQQNFDRRIVGANVIILCKSTKSKYTEVTAKKRLAHFTRIGVVATKKLDKRAVVRNKIKRMICEISRNMIFKDHFDYEIIAKKSILSSKYIDVYNEIKKLLSIN